jgi:flagellin-like hook-associated protein FlgL
MMEDIDAAGVMVSLLGTGNPVAAKLYASFGFSYLVCSGVMVRFRGCDMVDFIRKLSYNTTGGSNDGAGSVITDDLSTGGNDIIDSYLSASPGDAFYVGLFGSSGAGNSGTSGSGNGSNVWTMQIGPNADDRMDIDIGIMNTTVLGVDKATVNISTQTAANSAIDTIKEAINNVSTQRARLGAYQNRLEYTMNNLSTTSENIQSAESRIRDTDMAKEMMAYTKNNILIQAAQAMLGQANLAPQSVLALVQ